MCSLLAAGGVVVLLPLPDGWSSGWRGEFINRLHVPLMGVCCVALEGLFRTTPDGKVRSMSLALFLAVLLAALIEIVQPWFHRTADLGDFLWGMIGIAAGTLWNIARMFHSLQLRLSSHVIAVVILLFSPLTWAAQVLMASQTADRMFPVLTDFTGQQGGFYWFVETYESSQGSQTKPEGHLILERTSQKAASAHLDARDRDWSFFDRLEVDGTLEASEAVEIGLRLDLGSKSHSPLRTGGWITPGRHQIQICWPSSEPPQQVHQMVVFLAAGKPEARLVIHQLRLLPRGDPPSP